MIVYSIKWLYSKEKCILYRKYSKHLHQTNIITLTILPAINKIKYYLISSIITILAFLAMLLILQI